MAYRQPVPSWRAKQLAEQEAERDQQFQQNVVGDIMAGPAFEEAAAAIAAAADVPKGAQAEHHSIGKDFILAGRAVFTVAGKERRFTFRINRKESENPRYPDPSYFVGVLTGESRTREEGGTNYAYVGLLDGRTGQVKFTKGSKIQPTAPAAVALQWTLARVWAGRELPPPAAIYHEGRCGRCGRPLTVPESILTGFGPECAGLLGIPMRHEDEGGEQ